MSAAGPVRGFFGGLLMVVGGILTALAGACTVYWTWGTLSDVSQGHGWGLNSGLTDWLLTTAMIGGAPILLGVALFFLGRWLRGRRHG